MVNRQAKLALAGPGGPVIPSPGSLNPSLWLSSESSYMTTNGARSFPGGGGRYMSLAEPPEIVPDDSFFVSCWVRINSTAIGGIAAKYDNANNREWYLSTDSSNRYRWTVLDGSTEYQLVSTGATVTIYDHLVAIWDKENARMRLYLNGTLNEERATSTSINTVAAPLWIGRYGNAYTQSNIHNLVIGKPPGPIDLQERWIIQAFWNGGVRLEMANLTSQQVTDFGCEFTRWMMDERSGNAIPVAGSYELVENGVIEEGTGAPNKYAPNYLGNNTSSGVAFPTDGDPDFMGRLEPVADPDSAWTWNINQSQYEWTANGTNNYLSIPISVASNAAYSYTKDDIPVSGNLPAPDIYWQAGEIQLGKSGASTFTSGRFRDLSIGGKTWTLTDGPDHVGQMLPNLDEQDQHRATDEADELGGIWRYIPNKQNRYIEYTAPVLDPRVDPDWQLEIRIKSPNPVSGQSILQNGGDSVGTSGVFMDHDGSTMRLWVSRPPNDRWLASWAPTKPVGEWVTVVGRIDSTAGQLIVTEDGTEVARVNDSNATVGNPVKLWVARRSTAYGGVEIAYIRAPGVDINFEEGISGTTIADGIPINRWAGRTPNNEQAVQFGAFERPTWRSNGPYVEFNGAQAMETIRAIEMTNGAHFFIVAGVRTVSTILSELSPTTTTPGWFLFPRDAGGNSVAGYDSGGLFCSMAANHPTPAVYLCDFYMQGGDQRLYINGAQVDTDTGLMIEPMADDKLYIAARGGTSLFCDCDIYSMILYPRKLDDADAADVRAWLAARYPFNLP